MHVLSEKRRQFGFSARQFLAVSFAIAVIALALFSVLARHSNYAHDTYDPTPIGYVVDGYPPGLGKPIPGAVLRFRDVSHHLIATVTANGQGAFQQVNLPVLCGDPIDGYAFVNYSFSSGGPDGFYWFAPTRLLVAAVHNAAGKAMPDIPITLEQAAWYRGSPATARRINAATGLDGSFRLPNVPLCALFDIKSNDKRYVVANSTRILKPDAIHYDVTLTAPATITGRLVSTGDSPVEGFYAFVTNGPNVDNGEGRYQVGITGANGRFRITALSPGIYYVSAKPPFSYHSIAAAKRVRVGPGQTADIQLRSMVGQIKKSFSEARHSRHGRYTPSKHLIYGTILCE